jgi:RNA polymerase sigma factor (TIGR02999 family)
MPSPESSQVTVFLKAWTAGDAAALDRLTPLVYDELRRMARRYMRNERAGNTLQTTALVNEAYIRLIDVNNVNWSNRVHFFAVSAQMMRRILVDAARARASAKRGGLAKRVAHSTAVNLDEIPDARSNRGAELLAVDDSLQRLAEFDPRKAQVVELRYFGGLSVEESAAVLKISPDSFNKNLILVCTRTMLVCSEEERSLVREAWTKLDDLGLTIAKVHHGWF